LKVTVFYDWAPCSTVDGTNVADKPPHFFLQGWTLAPFRWSKPQLPSKSLSWWMYFAVWPSTL